MRAYGPVTLHETPGAYRIRGGTWEYALSRATGLIESAIVRGDSWLAAPVPDLWASGAVDPRADAYHARHSPDTVVRLVSASSGVVVVAEGGFARVDGAALPLRWQLTYTFESDGTVRVDMETRAPGATTLRWLSLGRGEVDRAACRFLAHEGDVGAGSLTCRPVCHDLASGDFEAGGRFLPWIHFGNDRGGLEIVFPYSDRAASGWTDSSPYPAGDPLGRGYDRTVVSASGGRVSWESFTIRNLHEPVAEGWRIEDTFFLSLLPGKEPDPAANDLRVWWIGPHQYVSGWHPADDEEIARWAAAGANLVVGGPNWRSGDYSHPDHPEETERFVATCHRLGLRVLPYLTFTDLEFGAPAFAARGKEWRIEPVCEYNYRSHLMCYGAEGWQEHWEREVAAAWERFPFDGLYLDLWASRLGCRNQRHGCAGPHGRFNAAGLRRMARFAAGLVAQREGILLANSNVLPLAMLNNWFDVRLLGEWRNLEEVEALHVRVFHNSHRFGSANHLATGRIPRITERALALTATYQGLPSLSRPRAPEERERLSRRARLLASFGTDRARAWNTFELPAVPELEGVQPSLYRRDDNGEILLTLSRAQPDPATVPLHALEDLCGPLSGERLYYCVETGEVLGRRPLAPKDLGELSLDVPGESLRTLWIRPDPGAPCLLAALSGRARPEAEWRAAERQLRFLVEHPALETAEVALVGAPASLQAGEQSLRCLPGIGCVRATVPCNTPVVVTYPPPRQAQICMRFTRFDDLPEVETPAGYAIRAYRPGDEAAWAAILNASETLGHWDVERIIRMMQTEHRAIPEGSFFATWNGVPVAAACATMGPGQERPMLSWVGADPAHRGKRLAYHACLAVLRFFRGQGIPEVRLSTNDFRIPALKTYLRLGFEPCITDASHPERWRRIFERLRG